MNDTPISKPLPNPKGMFCPNCRGIRLVVTSRKRPAPGLRIRYLRCVECAARLKTEERMTTLAKPKTVPTSAPHS